MSSALWGPARRQRAQSGVWLATTAMIVVFAFGLVADGAVLFAAHRRALALADAAALAGAGQIDVVQLRSDSAARVRLDAGAARATALAFIADHAPEASAEVSADPQRVLVQIHLAAPTAILHPFGKPAEVVAEAEAAPFSGVQVPTP